MSTSKKAAHFVLAALLFHAKADMCQNVASDAGEQFVGDWKGPSICLLKASACHDEVVFYHISRVSQEADELSVSAERIIGRDRVVMGVLQFRYVETEQALICEYGQGLWMLKLVSGDLEGMLTRPDKVPFRKVSLTKQQ